MQQKLSSNRLKTQALTYIDYFFKETQNPQELWILLHGYGQTFQHIYKRVESLIPDNVSVLAPNGSFPIVQNVQTIDKLGFAWYFYDKKLNQYFIDFEVPCSQILTLVQACKLEHLPVRIIGYSQGGYLAPFLAEKMNQTFHVLGINCSVRVDLLKQKINYVLDQVHADQDEIVEIKLSKERFQQLASKGNKGKFVNLKDETHFFSRNYLDPIRSLIANTSHPSV